MIIVYTIALALMALCAVGALVYAAIGKRFTDKIVAVNVVATLTMNMILVMAVMYHQDYLLDIALLFALLGFMAVQVLCRVVVLHHKGRMQHLKENVEEGETPMQALDRIEREEGGSHI